ncbi:FtsQ-type POTRA domain-containing protein [Erythrobacter sp.]|uniref:cell division protein FtsQ/DivIB n=1 Tax=Erythrobacter sp. TaxID=1042 RepID=UPI001425C871|nr:FtsQ-type POTRA domain-containing protein [Erythrobacter sp.]QIQ86812.1 MAG: FtsQ-type POTRA domain-containing protein [Erythrobacter sp.]
MANRIRRSDGRGVRRAAKSQSRAAGARRAKAKTSGVLDRAMGLLPFTEEQWTRIWLSVIIGAGVALGFVIANFAGLPALAEAEVARMASGAGFEVRRVRVTGTNRMDEREVYARALAQRDRAMPEVDVEALRAELLDLPWVADARVSKQLPETLAIDIVEREPHAVLVKPDRLVLVDITGHELSIVAPEDAADRLRISGPGAGRQVAALDRLLAAAPALAPKVEAAEWVGNRRWNVTFESGQVLALPEGENEAASALVKFARMDGQNRLIGGKVASFDMRNPPRVYMRVPGRGERVLADASDTSSGEGGQ